MSDIEIFKEANQIIKEVEKMRDLQKEWLKYKQHSVLQKAKDSEKTVDGLIKIYNSKDLFNT